MPLAGWLTTVSEAGSIDAAPPVTSVSTWNELVGIVDPEASRLYGV